MNAKKLLCLVLFGCGLTTAFAQQQVAFVRQGQQWIATEISAQAQQVPGQGDARITPRWSPDGSRVAFARSNEVHGRVNSVEVIIAKSDASIQSRHLINYGDQPGQRLAGARAIKELGWLGNDRFFLVGDISPRMEEARVFRAMNGEEVEGFIGTGFAGCPRTGRIAYMIPNGPDLQVHTDAAQVASMATQNQPGALRLLAWRSDCSQLLALRPGSEQTSLVDFRSGQPNSLKQLPALAYLKFAAAGTVLAFEAADGQVIYVDLDRLTSGSEESFIAARPAFDRQRRARESLGSEAFDYWPR